MRMPAVLLLLLLASACGKSSDHNSPTVARPPVVTPPTVRPEEFSQIAELKPTMYYVPQEDAIKCEGRYRSVEYTGAEKSNVLDPEGRVLATVCTRFLKTLDMEGTGILKDRGAGKVTVNFAARVDGEIRYRAVKRCIYGEGIRPDLCLLPYHTIAADNKVHKINEIIYIPRAEGIVLPDGTLHEGYFIVRDTGGAFDGIGAQRIDLFTGLEPDINNVFSRAGFNHNTPMEAFKVNGESAEIIRERLQARFGDIY
jgi:3D (Asp-Asp-Asp) domain-containing protein